MLDGAGRDTRTGIGATPLLPKGTPRLILATPP
jgi:hypothetical protein